jgi:hypothetical protein
MRRDGSRRISISSNAKTFTLSSFWKDENSATERPGLEEGEKIMRRYRLSICLAVVGLAMSLGYSTSQAPGVAWSLLGFTERPPRCVDCAAPPPCRTVRFQRRLQVRGVLL